MTQNGQERPPKTKLQNVGFLTRPDGKLRYNIVVQHEPQYRWRRVAHCIEHPVTQIMLVTRRGPSPRSERVLNFCHVASNANAAWKSIFRGSYDVVHSRPPVR